MRGLPPSAGLAPRPSPRPPHRTGQVWDFRNMNGDLHCPEDVAKPRGAMDYGSWIRPPRAASSLPSRSGASSGSAGRVGFPPEIRGPPWWRRGN